VRQRRSNYYPVVANPNEAVRDDLAVLAQSRRDVLMTCVLNDHNAVETTATIGDLDPKQQMTFEVVSKRGETDAGELMRANRDGLTHTTAWNNRL
jgi:hypothetical protein